MAHNMNYSSPFLPATTKTILFAFKKKKME